jgi:hypothetical protein
VVNLQGMTMVEVISAATAFIATLIAAMVAAIAYRQYKVSNDQMRHNLFDRRFDLFRNVQKFLGSIVALGNFDYEKLPLLNEAIQQSYFLFGKEVTSYLKEIHNHAFALKKIQIALSERTNGRAKREQQAEAHTVELKWIMEQLDTLHRRFIPYMNFSHQR